MAKLAVIQTGGKQYRVMEGDVIKVEKLAHKDNSVVFAEVLLVADEDGKNVQIGQPVVEGATVQATVVEEGRDKKVNVVKYKRKTRYRRKQGHRQAFTKVKIGKISA
jgi:large subunit ribosomal protein L21